MSGRVLRLDPIACDGHGICAELLPERIGLDDWGFPVIAPGPVPPELVPAARRAVAALALPDDARPTRRRNRHRGRSLKRPFLRCGFYCRRRRRCRRRCRARRGPAPACGAAGSTT